MIRWLLDRYRNSGDERGKRIFQQITAGAFLKIINSIVGVLIIPLYLALLTETSFGIWLTVSSVINWFNIFDLGLGNGLRNRFAEAMAKGEHEQAKIYVSTAYFCIGGIAAILLILFFIAHQFVDWGTLFAAPEHLKQEVNQMTLLLTLLFLPQFAAQLIKMLVIADQRPAWANFMNSTVNILQLGVVYLLVLRGIGGLLPLALALGSINLLVPVCANIWLFFGRYQRYAPSWKWVQLKFAKDLVGLGMAFFVLQGAALVVFMTDNLIISQVLGPEEVPAYNISYRYFNFATVFFALVTTPFWSAFTEAYAKKDQVWIARMMKKLLSIWLILAVACATLFLIAPYVYPVWIGEEVSINRTIDMTMAVWVVLSSFLSIFGTLLSGIGKLRMSLAHAVFVMVINIPLSIWLAGFPSLGAAGVMVASILGAALRLSFQPLQCYRLIRGTATGIWNR